MIDKSQAVSLREQGHTYKEIADLLGCSEIWCKKTLKDVKRGVSAKGKPSTRQDAKLEAIAILEDALRRVRAI